LIIKRLTNWHTIGIPIIKIMKMENLLNLKFFIVDDDPFYRMFYRQHLINMGFKNNIVFDNGKDCLESIDMNPDVILVDFHMLPCNGLEVIKQVKVANPGIFLLLVSSDKNNELATNAISSGAFNYILKGDNDLEMLSDSINKIVKVKQYALSNRKINAYA
jgi:DNA-binding NtrC family response regulator